MITPAEAAAVITKVSLVHRRTAPRPADATEAAAMAEAWAEVLNLHDLDLADLIAAVIRRAATESDAPEPADLAKHARIVRRERFERMSPDERAALIDAKIERLGGENTAPGLTPISSPVSSSASTPRQDGPLPRYQRPPRTEEAGRS